MKDTRTEREISDAIKKFLRQMGWAVWSTSQGRASAVTKGTPDLFAMGHGLSLWIECKTATGKQTAEQAEFQAKAEANGANYLLARSEYDVAAWINERIAA